MYRSAVVVTLVAGSAVLGAQAPVIRSKTQAVEVTVTVTDGGGNRVAGLTQGDFRLFDEGKPQTISLFVADAPLSNMVTGQGGHAVILLDWLNTGWVDQAQSRQQVLAMLRQIGVHDQIAIAVLSRGMRVVHDFTADRAALIASLGRLHGDSISQDAGSAFDVSQGSVAAAFFGDPPERTQLRGLPRTTEQMFAFDRRVHDTVAAFEALAASLAPIPGKKTLIWLSAGFPLAIDGTVVSGANPGERTYHDEIDRAVQKLAAADVSIHAIDARGLPVGGRGYLESLQELASRTGGDVFHDRNDLATGLRRALDDLHGWYSLGFYPDDPHSGFHRLRVQVRRQGVVLRYRAGYLSE